VPDALRLHTVVHLRFYVRNRLVLAFALLVSGIAALTIIPSLVYGTDASRFDALKETTETLYEFASFVTAGLGLFAMWSHMSERSVKLVLTRPSPPGRWVAAILLSAFLVTVIAHVAVTLFTFSLSVMWGVSYPIGFVFVALHNLCGTLVVLSFLTALATLVHPVFAVLVMLVFNDNMVLRLRELIEAGIGGTEAGWLRPVQIVLGGIYAVMPMTNPFASQLQSAHMSLRVSAADWGYLAASATYALAATAFFYALSVAILRRKTLI
jgi:hypothetical protein